MEEYDFLRNRLIIEWGKSAISWHQKLLPKDKEVLEIRTKRESLEVFDDYLDFTLTYEQLSYIVNNSDANYEWRARLSAVAGVYLILDSKTGQQYIGSAYGSKGIWGRWEGYATNGHGNNKTLVSILNENPERKDDFVFSILQILPKSCAKEKVIKIEHKYMFKLGTKVTGLNN
ncbi:MAG: GIY-YIG nuclease family protein [bacterium]